MRKIITYIGFLTCILFSGQGQGQGQEQAQPETLYGLAMHGAPKYSSASEHLDYVNPDAPKGGTLKQAATGTFDNLNPYAIKGKAAEGLNLVYDRLMQRVWDEPFTLYPLIAEKVEVPEDRSSLTVHINPDARFHNGSPVTADDVLYSWEVMRDKGRANMRRVYALASNVEKHDERSLTFHFGEGRDRETVMIFAMMPVLSKTWWSARDFDSTILEPPLLSGPYKIAEIKPGSRIVYERVPDYWAKDLLPNKGQYNFDRIVYDYYRDDTVALEAFTKGDLNFRREYDIAKWASAYDPADEKMTMLEAPHERPERAHSMIFNLRRPPFDDIRVRKALSLVFDGDWIGRNIYYGRFERIDSYFPNSKLSGAGTVSGKTLELLRPYSHTLRETVFGETLDIIDRRPLREKLREASRLLEEAGWVVKNGRRVHEESGDLFTFEMIMTSAQEEKIALNFKNVLNRLGIRMQVRVLDSAAFQRRINDYDFDMVVYYWQNSLSPGTEQVIYWSCEAAEQKGRWNFSGVCHPALDKMAYGIAGAKDYQTLTDYARAIDRILLSEYIAIPLFYRGADYIALREPVTWPGDVPLYGIVPETFWAAQ